MQPQRGGATYMDVDEAAEDKESDDKGAAGGVDGKTDAASGKADDGDDNVTEQTHHIIVPSYRCVLGQVNFFRSSTEAHPY